MTVANVRRNAVSVFTAVAADRLASPIRRNGETFVACAFFGCRAVPVVTAAGASRHAELSVLFKDEAFVTRAGVVVIAEAVAAHDGTRGEAKARQIPHVIRKAVACVGRRAETVHTLRPTDGIAFPKVVNVPLITFAAHLDAR